MTDNEIMEENILQTDDDIRSEAGIDTEYEEKRILIQKFLKKIECSNNEEYIEELRSFAISNGGLINDDIRKVVWPLLLGITIETSKPYPKDVDLNHPEASQVVLDVNRSIKRFPPAIPSNQRVSMQDQLVQLILKVMKNNPKLCYYQGYHDVAITFLLVVGEEMAFHIMDKLSNNHLRTFMEPTMEKTALLLEYVFPLLNHINSELCEYVERAEMGAIFSLPWFLTWYSHTINDYENVVRLYDYFLASEPLIPLYLIPVIMDHRQDDIFQTECEMSSLHQTLSNLPENLPFDDLLIQSTNLYNKFPPHQIENESKIRQIKRVAMFEEIKKKSKKPQVRKHINFNFMRILPIRSRGPLMYRLSFLVFGASFILGLVAYYKYGYEFYDIYKLYDQRNIATK